MKKDVIHFIYQLVFFSVALLLLSTQRAASPDSGKLPHDITYLLKLTVSITVLYTFVALVPNPVKETRF